MSAVAVGVISALAASADLGTFDRYTSITPDKVLSTTYEYRQDDLSVLPGYLTDYPLGAGLGVAGPAASVSGGPPAAGMVNAESQLNFLVLELGIPGLLAFLALSLTTLWQAMTRCRRIDDGETRVLLAAVAAPLFALVALWLSGITSTSVPTAPYFWFATGVLAYWLGRRRGPAHAA